jgi:hypothetical protein
MREKRRLLSMTEEDLKLLLSLRTEEKFYIDIFRKALKNAVILKWAETYEPDLYYQLVRKYKEFLNSQQSQQTIPQQQLH